MKPLGVNRMDQYDLVHEAFVERVHDMLGAQWENVRIGCGIRIVTSDTSTPVTCFNCLVGEKDWKYG